MMAGEILIWWLASTLLGLAGLPLATFLFRALPDRGYPFARALGLLLVGYLGWLLAMLGVAPFSAGSLLFGALLVFGIGMLAQRRRSRNTTLRERLAAWRERLLPPWQQIAFYEAVFLLALVFLALLRAHSPDPWGTERPMDFAFFNAIQRSGMFPPHDPWLSGYSINYYYLGYLLMAGVALLAGLDPAVGFNLSLALVFALTAQGIAGMVCNLVALSQRYRPNPRGGWGRNAAAALAVVLVLLVGNQGGVLEVVTGLPDVLSLQGGDMLRAIQNGLGARQPLALQTPVQPWGAQEPTTVMTPQDMVANFNWWNPSRALWDSAPNPSDATSYYAITEFPIFSFFLGDMHPHVMALPFGLLALALALATLARPAAPLLTQSWRGWLELVLSAIVLGSLYMINSWDFPTYLLIFLGALLLLYLRLSREQATTTLGKGAPVRVIWPQLAQHALVVIAAAFGLFLPFYMTFSSLVGGKEPLINLPLFSTLTKTLGFVTWDKTPLHTLVIIFGLFLLPLIGFVFLQGARLAVAETSTEDEPAAVPPNAALGIVARPPAPASMASALLWVVAGAFVVGLFANFPLLFLLPLAVYALVLANEIPDDRGASFVLLAAGIGALVCFGTELVYIRDAFEGGASRMNTIFKFYYQLWLIWGTLCAYAVWWLLREWPRSPRLFGRLGMGFALGGGALLLAGALVYPWLSVGRTFSQQAIIGLEGKTPRQRTPGGAAGIAWLRANAASDAVVLESVGGSYDGPPGGPGSAGVSSSTGLATVIGWPGHESQWRAGSPDVLAQLGTRQNDVDEIYTTLDTAQAKTLLDRYRVAYVYIGEAERNRYDPASLDKFGQLGELVFQQDEVAIYHISR